MRLATGNLDPPSVGHYIGGSDAPGEAKVQSKHVRLSQVDGRLRLSSIR